MSLVVSTQFANAQASKVNSPSANLQLVLGNYCNSSLGTTISSNGDDGSGNYPAAGAIDGDRTEINIGAALGADNYVGKSSWRSSGVPSLISPAALTITFPQSTTLNRLKVYHLSTNPMQTYGVFYWNGSAWVLVAGANYSGPGVTPFTSTGQLDVINFPAITTTQLLFNVYGMANPANVADVIEIEAYDVVDITSRCKGIKIKRTRDYKLANPMASTVTFDCINNDRFFSIQHVPTAAEVSAGFVNQQLQPAQHVVINMGFNIFGAGPETPTVFFGQIDSITPKPKTRDCQIDARDDMKILINRIDSTNLKVNQSLDALIRYLLNRSNVSNYEMLLDSSAVNVPYFFTDQEDPLTVIRDLTQATGDALFYFNENGWPVLKIYASNVPQSFTWTSEADFEAGTLANIATLAGAANLIQVPPQFAPALAAGTLGGSMEISGPNLTLPLSVPFTGASDGQSGASLKPVIPASSGDVLAQRYVIPRAGTITSVTIGPWSVGGSTKTNYEIDVYSDSGGQPDSPLWSSGILTTGYGHVVTVNPNLHVGPGTYYMVLRNDTAYVGSAPGFPSIEASTGPFTNVGLVFNNGSWVGLGENPSGVAMAITSSFAFTYDPGAPTGTWTSPWYDSQSLQIGTTGTYVQAGAYPQPQTSSLTIVYGSDDGSTPVVSYPFTDLNAGVNFAIANHRYWQIVVTLTSSDDTVAPIASGIALWFGNTGTWTSPVHDTGTNTTSLGILDATIIPGGGMVNLYSQTSPDGSTWSGFVPVSGTGQMQSPVNRYLQVQVVIALSADLLSTPLALDVTPNWTGGTGTPKYPPPPASFVFTDETTLLDCQQQLADNLGGDSAVINDAVVQAEPLVLTGATSDTVFQGSVGTPPVDISPSSPLVVTNGQQLVIAPYISGGMDTTYMTGADPAAAVVTFGAGAAGNWSFTQINPTIPILVINVTSAGEITDLRLVGMTFSNASYLQVQQVKATGQYSPDGPLGDRQLSISNPWIVSPSVALTIAQTVINNQQAPISYIPTAKVNFTPSLQIGDRCTIQDVDLDLDADYIIVGVNHTFTITQKGGTINTDLTLLKIPAGL